MSGWKTVALEEIADIERDSVAASAIRDGTLYVGLENIQSGGNFLDVRAVDGGELASSKFAFTEEHLLYGKLRPYLAKIARPTFAGVCSTDILPIKPGPLLDRDYLSHFLRQPGMVDFANSRATGANLPRLSPRVLANFEIPLPPLPEQRRIAAILDQAETLRTQRRAALAQLDSLTQSLFLDMFGDPVTNPKGWPVTNFESISQDSRIGLVRGSKELGPENPFPYLRMNAIGRDGDLQLAGAHRAMASPEELRTYKLAPGDFLFNTRNSRELVGKTALFRDGGLYLFNNNLLRVRFHAVAHPEYVGALFRTQFIQNELEQRKSGTTNVFAIYYKDLRTVPIPLPPLPLQQTFATRIQAIEALKTQHRAALAAQDALFASLQQRAFAGTL